MYLYFNICLIGVISEPKSVNVKVIQLLKISPKLFSDTKQAPLAVTREARSV